MAKEKHMELAPIVLFVYNRPTHTRKTVDALKKNEFAEQSMLFIFSDASKNDGDRASVAEVRQYIRNIDGFKTLEIIERDKNYGVDPSIIDGATEIISLYGTIIVLEDDLVSSPYFLQYMNKALTFYEKIPRIFSITGYSPSPKVMRIPSHYRQDIYFNPRPHSWSWATWKDRWAKADWEVKDFDKFIKNRNAVRAFNRGGQDLTPMLQRMREAWDIRWCYTLFKENAYCVYPIKSLINNIGFDDSGVHCSKKMIKRFENTLDNSIRYLQFSEKIELDDKLIKNFRALYNPGIIQRIKHSVENVWAFRGIRKK